MTKEEFLSIRKGDIVKDFRGNEYVVFSVFPHISYCLNKKEFDIVEFDFRGRHFKYPSFSMMAISDKPSEKCYIIDYSRINRVPYKKADDVDTDIRYHLIDIKKRLIGVCV